MTLALFFCISEDLVDTCIVLVLWLPKWSKICQLYEWRRMTCMAVCSINT